MEQKEVILDVQHLQTYFLGGDKKHRTEMRASDDLSYQVHKGEFVAIVGESGSGKSVSALSVMGLIPYPPGLVVGGKILFHGKDLVRCTDEEIQAIRGSKISMIFQEPSTALNPVVTIGKQIAETIRIHDRKISKKLVELAKRENIPYQLEAMGGRTGTNCDEISTTRGGVRTGLISVPQRNMHTPAEVCDFEDMENIAKLIAAYITDKEAQPNA